MRLFNIFPALLLLTLAGGVDAQSKKTASAQDEDSSNREAMATIHSQMAEAHTKMAECLASDRPIKECRQEMASRCSSMHGMMGESGMHGRMGRGMMGGMYGCPMMNDSDQPMNNDKSPPNKSK